MTVDVWLYGALARHVGQTGFANLKLELPAGSTMADLLAQLDISTKERGITFINGQLSALPGRQPDLGHVLKDSDRVGLFDPKSMWPYQYRHGALMSEELTASLEAEEGKGPQHTYG